MNNKKMVGFISLGLFLCFSALACQTERAQTQVFGNRIPRSYFVTWGQGESDVTTHAGSYDDALRMAKIENFNILTYSSILPPEAVEIPIPPPEAMHHGAVLESISAVADGTQGETITAGITWARVKRKSDGQILGGFVAEYHGKDSKEKAEENLRQALEGIFARRYRPEEYELHDQKILVKSFVPTKKFGTVIVLLGFTDYIFPGIKN
jgi:Uncharacterized conserved protein